jgi:hypothetical protein
MSVRLGISDRLTQEREIYPRGVQALYISGLTQTNPRFSGTLRSNKGWPRRTTPNKFVEVPEGEINGACRSSGGSRHP